MPDDTCYYFQPTPLYRFHWDGYNFVLEEFRKGVNKVGIYKGKEFSGWYIWGYYPSMDWFTKTANTRLEAFKSQERRFSRMKDPDTSFARNVAIWRSEEKVYREILRGFEGKSIPNESKEMKAKGMQRELSEESLNRIREGAKKRKRNVRTKKKET